MTFLTASLLITGSVPGWPIQVGQTKELGFFLSKLLKQEQNILESVFSSICISSPMVGLYIFFKNHKRIIIFIFLIFLVFFSLYLLPFGKIHLWEKCVCLKV